jgi:hypothetical protein
MPMVGFPLLLIPIAIYNMIVFLMPGVTMAEPLAKLTLMSGAEWPLTLNDMLLALGIVLLMFEVIKGARPGAKYLTDHVLSLVVFGAAAAEFMKWPRFGTSTFFLLALLALVDFLSGLALRTRRGMTSEALSGDRDALPLPANATEPQFEPAPAPPPAAAAVPAPASPPAVQAAASVAEAVLLDRPEPKFTPVEVTPDGSSPKVLSPGLQPVDSPLPSTDSPPD